MIVLRDFMAAVTTFAQEYQGEDRHSGVTTPKTSDAMSIEEKVLKLGRKAGLSDGKGKL